MPLRASIPRTLNGTGGLSFRWVPALDLDFSGLGFQRSSHAGKAHSFSNLLANKQQYQTSHFTYFSQRKTTSSHVRHGFHPTMQQGQTQSGALDAFRGMVINIGTKICQHQRLEAPKLSNIILRKTMCEQCHARYFFVVVFVSHLKIPDHQMSIGWQVGCHRSLSLMEPWLSTFI